MTDRASSSYTAAELADPSVGLQTLTQLAQERHDLWPWIIVHPNCSAELAAWIRPQLSAAQTPSAVTAEEWSARFQQTNHREPTMNEYQEAVRTGQIAAERKPRDPSAEQIAAGAKQMAAGAKDFFTTHVAPAAQEAARSVQSAVQEQRSAPQNGPKGWMSWAPFALPVAAFLAMIALFLPIASGFGLSFNYFSEYAGGEGAILLVLMLLVIAASVTAIILRVKWARITAAVLGMIAGIVGAVDGFGTMISVSSISGASVGAGAVLLAIFSIVILVAAIVCVLPQNATSAAPAATPAAPATATPATPAAPPAPPAPPAV
ncbi:hypothetical protein ACSS7Z_08760 [Microbacterium sp. A82]|uniref:variant leucine-rich repeat-containing protein n=1 Tax=Microbacterium sp. A82 TaxID=3450452 RepID=UPI003F2A31F8